MAKTAKGAAARKGVQKGVQEKTKDREYVLRVVKEKNVKFIRFWFTDILGNLKNFAITYDELELSLYEGQGFDGSSIQGFARIDESDMVAMPDPSTFQLLPWRSGPQGNVGRMFCDILNPDGTPYEGDPRYVLKRNLKEAAGLGYTFYVGPELEFFLFRNSDGTEILDHGGYFDMTTLDAAANFRRDAVLTLQALGIDVEYSHHEVGPSQHEIDLRYADALTMADNCMTYRLVVKETAMAHTMYATFMPKPLFGENGSGMHTHQSLFTGSKNAFFDPKDRHYLSDVAKGYIAGLLRHIPEITLVLNQWVNSYKRLVPGYEAPVYLTWAIRNRSDLVRVPIYKPGKEQATRVELRSPDPACNPYFAFSAMLAAGLAGIKGKYKLDDPVERNVYEMTERERGTLEIRSLPSDLNEAIKEAEKSELLRKSLGDHVFTKLLENKRMEWHEYRAHVSRYELEKYLPIL
ncbi:MAG: glutamine synthetase [Candidatus Tectomicrobia bacterium]|nr:glutamine synthetase [Candidatus Tectomicrobia bacterium]